MSRLKNKYLQEVRKQLKDELQLRHDLAVPQIKRISVNVGVGDAKDNQAILDAILANVGALTGQKPVVNRAKGAISNFKLGKGQPVGVSVTLRGDRMYEFLDRLISIVLPKVRDFRGLPDTAFDKQGNYTLGLKEQAIFPEVNYQTANPGGKTRGLEITIVTTAKSPEEGRKLLALMGMPFKKEGQRN